MKEVTVESQSTSLVDDWFALNDDAIIDDAESSSSGDEDRILQPRNLRYVAIGTFCLTGPRSLSLSFFLSFLHSLHMYVCLRG